jgi:hypothetical protein
VKSVGSQPLENFKDLLTEEEYWRCQSNLQLGKTWFKMTTDVFISYLFRVRFNVKASVMFSTLLHSYPSFIFMIVIFIDLQQEIADASNDAARKFYEETEEADRIVPGVTAVMRAAAKAKQQSFKG